MSVIFPKRLKELREKMGLTQQQLGEKLNVADATINRYEKGLRTPDFAMLDQLARIFNTTTDYLLGRDNAATPPPDFTKLIPDAPNVDLSDITDEEAMTIALMRQAWSHLTPEQFEKKIKLAKKAVKIAKMMEDEEGKE